MDRRPGEISLEEPQHAVRRNEARASDADDRRGRVVYDGRRGPARDARSAKRYWRWPTARLSRPGLRRDGEAGGEVVFNTAMTGYQEILTDPSYSGQLVAMTYPEIGNVGVNAEDVESARVFVEGSS